MRPEKPNITSYLSGSGNSIYARPANILEILKKNKENRKSEKTRTIFISACLIFLFFIFGIYIFF